jgi:hypothetical protein
MSELRRTALDVAELELRRRRGALRTLRSEEQAAVDELARAVALRVTRELLEPLEPDGGDSAAPAVHASV